MSKKKTAQVDVATLNFEVGRANLSRHPLFSALATHAYFIRRNDSNHNNVPRDGYCVVRADGQIRVHPTRRVEPTEWEYVLAHALLHLAFDHFRAENTPEWNTACDCIVARFLADIRLGTPPFDILPDATFPVLPGRDEETLAVRFRADGIPPQLARLSVAGVSKLDMEWCVVETGHQYWQTPEWPRLFSDGLQRAVSSAVRAAAGLEGEAAVATKAENARAWFISSYPLLGAIAAAFKIIEDAAICNRLGISVAAINMESREIFFAPGAGLSEGQYRFVMAHEFLHAGLRHDVRCGSRDPYLWNVACDFVINDWLLEMGVGDPPALGMLHDPALRGMSAEAIYDLITTDLRRFRKLQTMRGFGKSDILEGVEVDFARVGEGTSLDAWYRNAMAQGLRYHTDGERGFLPADLIEEVNALQMPAISWDVELARWFDSYFPPLEKRRSYARLNRRQSATPDIPRPSWVTPEELRDARTFGVVLDTSGSMARTLLAKALGSIASYAQSRDVVAARVVFCDATAYDAGWMSPDDIAGRVQVRGRGGTILQPGVDLLESALDFPKEGPILIITDAQCDDDLIIHRDHAFLVPIGARLPFRPRGPVFEMR
jgi:predicted metal-dependent peptidase